MVILCTAVTYVHEILKFSTLTFNHVLDSLKMFRAYKINKKQQIKIPGIYTNLTSNLLDLTSVCSASTHSHSFSQLMYNFKIVLL